MRRFSFQGHPFLFVPFGQERDFGQLVQVETVQKEDALRDGDKWAREGRMALVTATPTCKVPVCFRNCRRRLENMLVSDGEYLYRRHIDA